MSLGVALGPLPQMTSAHPALWIEPSSLQSLEPVIFLKLVQVWNVCSVGEELESSPPQGLRLVEVYEATLHSFQMASVSCGSFNPSWLPCPRFPCCAKGYVTRPILTGEIASSFGNHFSTCEVWQDYQLSVTVF